MDVSLVPGYSQSGGTALAIFAYEAFYVLKMGAIGQVNLHFTNISCVILTGLARRRSVLGLLTPCQKCEFLESLLVYLLVQVIAISFTAQQIPPYIDGNAYFWAVS